MCIEGKEIEKNYSACIMEEKCDVRVDEEREKERNKWGMRLVFRRINGGRRYRKNGFVFGDIEKGIKKFVT